MGLWIYQIWFRSIGTCTKNHIVLWAVLYAYANDYKKCHKAKPDISWAYIAASAMCSVINCSKLLLRNTEMSGG